MRRLPALVAALLLPAAPPLVLGTAAFTGALLVSQAPAHAQSAEAVAKVAQGITVRIEGATQGSGVLVKHEGNRYTVLTAWHVVSGQRPGEEVDIYTNDGLRHLANSTSIQRLVDVDLCLLTFTSDKNYSLANISKEPPSSGAKIIIAGFPTDSSIFIQTVGALEANANIGLDAGIRLFYNSPTKSGMSGGPILSEGGKLLGVHARGEVDPVLLERYGLREKTGLNQGVPIAYYLKYTQGLEVKAQIDLPKNPIAKLNVAFKAASLPPSDFAIVAVPRELAPNSGSLNSGNRYVLNIIRQLRESPKCWSSNTDGSVNIDMSSFDFTGICNRFVDEKGFSVRLNGDDFQRDSSLEISQEGPYIVLYSKRNFDSQSELLPIAIARKPQNTQSPFMIMKILQGWTLEQRVYRGRRLGHVYFSTSEGSR